MADLTREELDALADEIRPPRDKGKRKSHVEQTERHVHQQLRISLESKPHKPPRDSRKFWAKVKHGGVDECWPWTGYIGPSGHGRTTLMGISTLASKKAWVLANGPILSGLCVNHKCDNPLCCNPSHMYLGTRADNMIDRWGKTSEARGERKRPHVLTQDQVTELYQMRRNGVQLKACAAHFGCCVATVIRIVTKQRQAKLSLLRQRVQKSDTDVHS